MSERMKAAALSATKGLSRVQAERAAANAARNVNAYGQKEEGPSRWQEKKEAKTLMYLKSTEKQATLNQKRCQKCHQTGHWTYECQKPAPENPKPEIGSQFTHNLGGVGIVKKEEKREKGLKKKRKKEKGKSKHRNKKRKHRSSSTSESSDSESDQEEVERRRKRKRHSRRSNH